MALFTAIFPSIWLVSSSSSAYTTNPSVFFIESSKSWILLASSSERVLPSESTYFLEVVGLLYVAILFEELFSAFWVSILLLLFVELFESSSFELLLVLIFSTAEFKLAELLSIVSTVVSVLSLVVSTDVLVSVVLLSFFVVSTDVVVSVRLLSFLSVPTIVSSSEDLFSSTVFFSEDSSFVFWVVTSSDVGILFILFSVISFSEGITGATLFTTFSEEGSIFASCATSTLESALDSDVACVDWISVVSSGTNMFKEVLVLGEISSDSEFSEFEASLLVPVAIVYWTIAVVVVSVKDNTTNAYLFFIMNPSIRKNNTAYIIFIKK